MLGESSVNPSVTGSMNAQEECDIVAGGEKEIFVVQVIFISHKLTSGFTAEEVVARWASAAVKILQDEIAHLDGVIQSSLARKSVLEAKVKALMEANSSDDSEGELYGNSNVRSPARNLGVVKILMRVWVLWWYHRLELPPPSHRRRSKHFVEEQETGVGLRLLESAAADIGFRSRVGFDLINR
ncbi:hypothetical protein Leryth_025820 [Lithospermum erythrorhizon]|nr:hypothetical protein Leryth_025820 [Lithospermum erythrorhizon]